MLRIVINDTASEQRWVLQGRLAGPYVAELSANWEQTQDKRLGRKAVIDLSDVTFIDKGGEEVLRTMMKEGAQFIACGICTKHVLETLDRAIHARRRRTSDRGCIEWGTGGRNGN